MADAVGCAAGPHEVAHVVDVRLDLPAVVKVEKVLLSFSHVFLGFFWCFRGFFYLLSQFPLGVSRSFLRFSRVFRRGKRWREPEPR